VIGLPRFAAKAVELSLGHGLGLGNTAARVLERPAFGIPRIRRKSTGHAEATERNGMTGSYVVASDIPGLPTYGCRGGRPDRDELRPCREREFGAAGAVRRWYERCWAAESSMCRAGSHA
jgi:hypothetical protein